MAECRVIEQGVSLFIFFLLSFPSPPSKPLSSVWQAMRTPLRDKSGVALLFQYYSQLYFVERRFFPPDRSLGIYFEWWVACSVLLVKQREVFRAGWCHSSSRFARPRSTGTTR